MSYSEDILNDSLFLLGESSVTDVAAIQYGPLTLTVAPKEGKANTLLADHLFSPALLLAERIEIGLLDVRDQTVVELGAGAGLPSLLMSTLEQAPRLVVITDYPDAGILGNVEKNVDRNKEAFTCEVKCNGYEWGGNPDSLFQLLPSGSSGFDIMILSDLLHFETSHDDLVLSIKLLLARSSAARVHVGAGSYTKPHVCDGFLDKATSAGLSFQEHFNTTEKWEGQFHVSGLDHEDLAVRKSSCRYWIGCWSESFGTT